MRRFTIGLLSALATVGLATAIVGGSAVAAPPDVVKTKVTIKFFEGGVYGDAFFGKVKSKKKACRKNRTVKVKRVGGGTVGQDKSDKKGNWRVDAAGNVPAGQYFAKAKKKKTAKFICKRAKSKTITVG